MLSVPCFLKGHQYLYRSHIATEEFTSSLRLFWAIDFIIFLCVCLLAHNRKFCFCFFFKLFHYNLKFDFLYERIWLRSGRTLLYFWSNFELFCCYFLWTINDSPDTWTPPQPPVSMVVMATTPHARSLSWERQLVRVSGQRCTLLTFKHVRSGGPVLCFGIQMACSKRSVVPADGVGSQEPSFCLHRVPSAGSWLCCLSPAGAQRPALQGQCAFD